MILFDALYCNSLAVQGYCVYTVCHVLNAQHTAGISTATNECWSNSVLNEILCICPSETDAVIICASHLLEK